MLLNIFNPKRIKLSFSENSKLERSTIKPHVLLILDGFGIAPESISNAISAAKTPNLNYFQANYPYSKLIAAGETVGLPANESGNSEVGHLTIGVGRIIYQSLPKINMAIKDGSFYQNKAFIQALNHVRNYNSKLHIMGLVGSGNVHSSLEHLMALMEYLRRNNFSNCFLHLFTDGRDAPRTDGVNVVKKIVDYLSAVKIAQIATITGRYWAMDRDARWERTKKAYDAIVNGVGVKATNPVDAVMASYQTNITDEFIEPTVIERNGAPVGVVNDNDAIIFFNFRIDRPRQLTMAFTFADFEKLKVVEFGYTPHGRQKHMKESAIAQGPTFERGKKPQNLFFVTMTEYQKNLPVSAIAFPPDFINNSMPEIISKANLKQFHLAESEKERMVTFYFDGLKDTRFPGEDVEIVSSPGVSTYDKKPEMSVFKIVSEFKNAILKDTYHFIVMNFANPDMVAHTGSLQATIKAVEYVDEAIGSVAAMTLKAGGTLYISADHGNAEELLSFPLGSFFFTTSSGTVNTEHSNSPVPLYIIGHQYKNVKGILTEGNLSDIAPTILNQMGIAVPPEMTGKNLIVSK
jgi:2,3-bisphosphoglycerate-independent phosphoglycerate mutase